ncbi:MAG: hypothetical protein IJ270_01905 [Paludibacteraceae bacterium]|nr:hypothetical protein [Paludibacteraceae bacterium]
MKKFIWVLLLLIIGVNLFANSGFRLNSNSTPISNFSIPLDVSYNTDYSYGLLGNETKQVWVQTSPVNFPMVAFGSSSIIAGLIFMPFGFAEDLNGMAWTGVGLLVGGVIVDLLSFAFPEGYYKTVEVVNNDGFKSEIYLASNIATTSVGYKMSFK